MGVFLLMRLGEGLGSAPGWTRHYVDDLICLPLVLSLTLAVQRLSGRFRGSGLPRSHGLLAMGIFAVFFEGILPLTGSGAVADPLDVLMYVTGFLIFQFGLNQDVAEWPDRADLAGMKSFPCPRHN